MKLKRNPYALITRAETDDGQHCYEISAPLPLTPLNRRQVRKGLSAYDAITRFKKSVSSGRNELLKSDVSSLLELGILVREDQISKAPQFYPMLQLPFKEDARSELVSVVARGRIEIGHQSRESLELPICEIIPNAERAFWHFEDGRPALPFFVPPLLQAEVDLLIASRGAPISVSPECADALVANHLARYVINQNTVAVKLSAEASSWYLKGRFMPDALVHAASEYYFECVRGGFFPYGDRTTTRYTMHDDLVGRFLQEYIHCDIALHAPFPITPTYTYFCGYRDGASMDLHHDLDQRDITVSLLLRCEDEIGNVSQGWSLTAESFGSIIEIEQTVGDSIAFTGRTMLHGRPKLPINQEADVLLMHFAKTAPFDEVGPV